MREHVVPHAVRRRRLGGLRAAVGLISVLPGGCVAGPDGATGRAWFPLVGAALGAAAGAAAWGVGAAASPLLGAVAGVAMLVVLTGALHVDALGDAADGLFGGHTPRRRLEIMRDSRLGSFGTTAVVLVLLAQVAALSALHGPELLRALFVAAALGRLGMLIVVIALPYVRARGLGTQVQAGRAAPELAFGALCAAATIAVDWRHGLLAAALALVATAGCAAFATRRIGGATGDVYGATLEVAQTSALIAFAVHL